MMNIKNWGIRLFVAILAAGVAFWATSTRAEDQNDLPNKIEKVEFVVLSAGRVAVRIQTTEPVLNPPAGFTLNNPPRIALDFLKVGNGLVKNSLTANQGVLKSVNLAQAKERTRMVLNLSKSVSYSTTVSGNETTIVLQGGEVAAAENNTVTRFAEAKIGDQLHSLSNVDFMRGKGGEGRILVDLSDATTGIDLKQKGKTIVVDFINTDIPANLQRRLNVINFNTPVLYIDTMKQGKNTRMVIEPKGNWEQSAYQADKRFIIDVRPVVEDPNKLVQGNKPGYAGEKLSLNFQNIDVRSVLQVIADFTGFNIITSDTVTGNITLRLKDVPWDQALDIIMQSKGLTQRKTGNVIIVAPAEEVAAKEKLVLEANQQIEDLEAMRTEVFTLKYMKAESLKDILTDEKQKILSKRGSAVLDPRTNTVFVQDISKRLEDIQRIINITDVPVKQVMIESRLVIADEKFGKSLGARFGVTQRGTGGQNVITTSGTLGNRITEITPGTGGAPDTITQGDHNGTIQTSLTGNPLISSDGLPDLMSNLPVSNAAGSLALSLFRLPAGFLLNLELSALESDNRGKVVSSPRVTTANQQKATIEQGTEIPYITPASSATTIPAVAFKKAVLSLEVTPQITPDNKIIMDLIVKKDRIGQIFNNIPSIDTQNVKTQVLVDNGETAVLGGIYEQTERNDVSKVPLFGNLPFVGNLFKRTIKQNDKIELLIFVTPKVMDDNMSIR
ncbi:MAG TPA: type IV pilus secretin PilQ [Methylophilaceae bacterium]|nr:type IV pilus secretin PilQ [Methylotenera sp.]HSH71810.1 type IV pilus secretin PilQ [Methylophilaceae bacterium]